ncbi:MAG: glycosyltransferase [bacterium]
MTLFLVALGVLIYTYAGYPLILLALGKLRRPDPAPAPSDPPSVSVIIAAFNEEEEIRERIANIFSSDYPLDRVEVVVVSDGSTDKTVEHARSAGDSRVVVLDFSENRGRAMVHNDGAAASKGDILIFSDAQSRFSPTFLRNITAPFSDPLIGCVSGVLNFINRESTSLGQSRGFYWTFEYLLRDLSSRAGVLAIASGACMAVRRDLFRPFGSATDDVDFITPIDVITQGSRLVHRSDAVAGELMFVHPRAEFRSRIRMTSRNWIGTWRRLRSCSIWRFPAVWWCLISHKFLRWLTPLFLLGIFVGSVLGWSNIYLRVACCAQIALYAWAAIGLYLPASVPGWLGAPTSFCVANAGFALGVLSALLGRAKATYDRNKEKT